MKKTRRVDKFVPIEDTGYPLVQRVSFVPAGWKFYEAYHIQYSADINPVDAIRSAFIEFKERYPLEARRGGVVFYGNVDDRDDCDVIVYRFINGKLYRFNPVFHL